MKKFPRNPAHPERNCRGCDQYCTHTDMRCGNGSVRTPHPIELFGESWDQAKGRVGMSQEVTPLNLLGKILLPVVQGGMGVGVSAGRLAGTVASLGAMGTISSVDLRRKHPNLMALTAHLTDEPNARKRIDQANLEALKREIAQARELSRGQGLIAVKEALIKTGF